MTKNERAVIAAAKRWWKGMRPASWSVGMHRDNPLVNTATKSQQSLAWAVARLSKRKSRQENKELGDPS
jgi:hypothetical protein